jgi:hypothetical protein
MEPKGEKQPAGGGFMSNTTPGLECLTLQLKPDLSSLTVSPETAVLRTMAMGLFNSFARQTGF